MSFGSGLEPSFKALVRPFDYRLIVDGAHVVRKIIKQVSEEPQNEPRNLLRRRADGNLHLAGWTINAHPPVLEPGGGNRAWVAVVSNDSTFRTGPRESHTQCHFIRCTNCLIEPAGHRQELCELQNAQYRVKQIRPALVIMSRLRGLLFVEDESCSINGPTEL